MASSDTTVEVVIRGTLDSSVQTSTTQAKAAIQGLSSSTSVSAQQMAAALKQVGGDLSKISPEMLGVASSAPAVVQSFEKVEEAATNVGRINFSVAARESRALFDELTSGRTRMVPGTLAIIAQSALGIGPAGLAALAGVALLTGGLALLVIRAHEAAEAENELIAASRNAGNFDVQKSQLQGYIDQLSRFPTVTKDAAREVVGAFVGMRGATEPEIQALIALTAQWAYQNGEKAPQAAKKLAAAFSDESISAQQLTKLFPQITQAQIDGILQAQRMGETHKRNAEMLQVLDQEVRTSVGAFHEHNASMFASASTFGRYLVNGYALVGQQVMHNQILGEQAEAWKKDEAAVRGYISALSGLSETSESVIEAATKAAEAEDHYGTRIKETKADIAVLEQGLVAARQAGDQIKVDQLTAGLKAAKENLLQLQSQQNKKDMFGLQQAGQEAIEAARVTISEINSTVGLGDAERYQQEAKVWKNLLAGEQLTAKQRQQVIIEMNNAMAQANRAQESVLAEVRRDDAETDLQLLRLTNEQKRALLEDDFNNHRINAEKKAELLRQYVLEEYGAQMDILLAEYAADGDSLAAKEATLNKMKLLEQQYQVDIAKIRKGETLDLTKELNRQEQAYKGMVREITTAEDSLVRDILEGRMSLTKSLLRFIGQLLENEIAADIKIYTTKALYNLLGLQNDRSTQQQSVLTLILGEGQKTSAAIAGSQARTAAEQAAQAESGAAQVASGSAQILNDAYKAAAGAYQAVVGIPVVGPVLAPIAAGVAFAAVSAFDVLTSAEGGAWEVGGGFFRLHERESVIPAYIATPMREFFEDGNNGGQSSAPAAPNVTLAISAIDGPSVQRLLKRRTIERQIARQVGKAFTLSPSTRGAF